MPTDPTEAVIRAAWGLERPRLFGTNPSPRQMNRDRVPASAKRLRLRLRVLRHLQARQAGSK